MQSESTTALKEITTWKEEVPIAIALSSDALRKDSRNYAAPVLLFPDTDELASAFMVMPILLGFDLLPFRRVGEFAEMFFQWLKVVSSVLKGLEMVHEHNIADWWDSFCRTSSFTYPPA
jgi:hypothetical protein